MIPKFMRLIVLIILLAPAPLVSADPLPSVHHDDAEREFAYDRKSPFGRLDRGLDQAQARDWQVVSMKNDWKRVFSEGGK